jgi:hypothetical protein
MTVQLAALYCLSLALQTPEAPGPRAPVDTAYLIDSLATVRATPEVTGKVVTTVKPLEIVMLYEAQPGWVFISVGQGKGKDPLYGWVKGDEHNILKAKFFDSILRLVKIRDQGWPLSVQADVVRQRPRVGFSKAQVLAALDEPATKSSEETSTGTTELWLYPAQGQSLTFKAGKVTAIRKVE